MNPFLRKAGLALALWLCAAPASHAVFWGTFTDHNITGQRGSWNFRLANSQQNHVYYIDIGSGCSRLTVQTGFDGGYGDCDLYLRFGALPTLTSYSRRSNGSSYRESIVVNNPPPGRYYIRLWAYSNYKTCIRFTASRTTYNWRTDFLARINNARAQRGLVRLTMNSRLQRAAQDYANDMIARNYYGGSSHHGSSYANNTIERRIAAAGYSFRDTKENIARRRTGGNSRSYVKALFDKWMSESDLRSRLLASNLRHAGFGYAYKSSLDYRIRWVADFAQPR